MQDAAKRILPSGVLVRLADPETGRVTVADFSDRRLRERFSREMERRDMEFKDLISKSGVDLVELSTDGSVLKPLTAYFRRREARR